MYFAFIHENGAMKLIDMVLRRGDEGEQWRN
jgi:hypothetical protein